MLLPVALRRRDCSPLRSDHGIGIIQYWIAGGEPVSGRVICQGRQVSVAIAEVDGEARGPIGSSRVIGEHRAVGTDETLQTSQVGIAALFVFDSDVELLSGVGGLMPSCVGLLQTSDASITAPVAVNGPALSFLLKGGREKSCQ